VKKMARLRDQEKQSTTEIDFSNIRNLDAVNKMEPGFEEMKNSVEEKQKSVRSKKFQFTDSELIPLPSHGKFYRETTDDEDILQGNIRMLSMTAKEEEILSTSRFIKSGAAIRMILDRCIESDISAKDILLFDSNYLMFHLRKLSYGDVYNFEIKCNNSMCGKKFPHAVHISQLEFNELPEDLKEPIEIKLERSKYTIHTIMPRLYHSEEISAKNSNRKKAQDEEDKRIIDNVLVTTVAVFDGEMQALPKREWDEFFHALPAYDLATIRDRTRFDTGVDTLEHVICPYCEEDYSGTIPIGADFFRI
jgi:hypothetical protein